MRATDVDNVAGDEVILSIGNGVRTVFDRTRTQRDATFSYNGTWGCSTSPTWTARRARNWC